LISVASTIGIGVGYPLAGLLTELAGLRAAYGLGAAVTIVALVAAMVALPPSPPGRSAAADVPGVLLLAGGLLALLVAVSEPALWDRHAVLAGALLVAAAALLAGFARYERGTAAPLIDVTLLRHPAVLGANAAILIGGMGMYLLLTIVTRYVQTPASAGYGFGVSTFVAGLALVPFRWRDSPPGSWPHDGGARLARTRCLPSAPSSC
jgi:MFS family permease